MATRTPLQLLSPGVSPDQARADYLARNLEQIRETVAVAMATVDRLQAALQHAWTVLDRIPRQP